MATNDTKIGCNNATTSEKSAKLIQYIVKWLSPQYAKRQVLENKKIRLGKYITPLRGP